MSKQNQMIFIIKNFKGVSDDCGPKKYFRPFRDWFYNIILILYNEKFYKNIFNKALNMYNLL